MKLSTVIDQVRNGDISGISSVPKTDKTLVTYINLGLISLYNRFQLRTEEAIITLQDGKTIYKLDGTDPDVTVNDQPMDPDDIVTINVVFDEVGMVPVNDNNDPSSVYTTTYNTLQIPTSQEGMYLSLIYKAGPKLITYVDDGNGNAVDTDIPLPLSLMEPLLMFIAYRSYLAVGDAGTPDADKYEMKYHNACTQSEALGLVPSDQYSRDVEDKGFI